MDVNAELVRLAQLKRVPRQDIEKLARAMKCSFTTVRVKIYSIRRAHNAALHRLRELDNAT